MTSTGSRGPGYTPTKAFLKSALLHFKTMILACMHAYTHIHTYYICVHEFREGHTEIFIRSFIHVYAYTRAYIHTSIHRPTYKHSTPIISLTTDNGKMNR